MSSSSDCPPTRAAAQYSAGPRRSALRRRRPDGQDMAVPSAPLPTAHAHCAKPVGSRPLSARAHSLTQHPAKTVRLPPAQAHFATALASAHACPTPPRPLRPHNGSLSGSAVAHALYDSESPYVSYLTIWQGATPVAAPFKLPAEKLGVGGRLGGGGRPGWVPHFPAVPQDRRRNLSEASGGGTALPSSHPCGDFQSSPDSFSFFPRTAPSHLT